MLSQFFILYKSDISDEKDKVNILFLFNSFELKKSINNAIFYKYNFLESKK